MSQPPLRSAPWTEQELRFCRALLSAFARGEAPRCDDGMGVAEYLAFATHCDEARVRLRFNTGMMVGRAATFARARALGEAALEPLADLEGAFRQWAESRLPEPPLTALYDSVEYADYVALVSTADAPSPAPASPRAVTRGASGAARPKKASLDGDDEAPAARKPCACGSLDHARSTHRDCPLNKRNSLPAKAAPKPKAGTKKKNGKRKAAAAAEAPLRCAAPGAAALEVRGQIEAYNPRYGQWFNATVVALDAGKRRVKVHYVGWGKKTDEWLEDYQVEKDDGPKYDKNDTGGRAESKSGVAAPEPPSAARPPTKAARTDQTAPTRGGTRSAAKADE